MEQYMFKCIDLAKKGLGLVSPNPLVGSIIEENGYVLGEGYHQKAGSNHAEVNAFINAEKNGFSDFSNATLYCNLEPCCHTKKRTPPCVDLILEKKIKKVVIGSLDPNPLVSGLGVNKLRENGVNVITLVSKKITTACEELNQIFFKTIKINTPYIHLKMATSLDGKVALFNGNSKWITSNESRKDVHLLRFKYDSISVGINTVLKDNPFLNIRMGVDAKGKVPFKIIFGFNPLLVNHKIISNINTDTDKNNIEEFNILKDNAEKVVFIIKKIKKNKYIEIIEKVIEKYNFKVIYADTLNEAMEEIFKIGIRSVLFEGGPKLFTSLIKENLFDAISIYTAPKFLSGGIDLFSDNYKLEKPLELKNTRLTVISENNFLTQGYNNVYRSC